LLKLFKTRGIALALAMTLPALTGCFVHVRRVPRARMPKTILTSNAEQLSSLINERYSQIHAMSAQVSFQLTEGGIMKGKEKTYASFSGYVLMRKPGDIRVIGFLPVIHSQAFDMASDGKTFTMIVPPKNKAFEGPNKVTEQSKKPLENLRPYIFFDSLLIQSIAPDDLVTLTADTKTIITPKKKHIDILPEYLLTILRRKSKDSNVLVPERVIHFDRSTLEPYEEDIYDPQGSVETEATFGPLKTFDGIEFPSSITIKRPLQEYQILVTFQNIHFNLHLTDDQFHVKIPHGMTVEKLH
jgi:outer membrane lipoprotein-sorting protein